MVDVSRFFCPAAHHGDIGFKALWPLAVQFSGRIRVEGKHEDTGGRFVQAMYRIDLLPKLIAKHLYCKTGFMAVDGAAVYQQATGLVNGNQMVVLKNYLQQGKHS